MKDLTDLSDWPYSWEMMQRLCYRLKGIMPPVQLQDFHVKLRAFAAARAIDSWTERSHTHWSYEAHIFLTGTVEYTCGGTQLLGPGSVILHRPGVRHHWHTMETPVYCFNLHFSLDPEPDVAETLPWPVWPELVWEIDLMLADVQVARFGWQERAVARMTVLLSQLLLLTANQGKCSTHSPEFEENLVTQVDSYLLNHMTEHITLEQIATEFGISERSLIRHFREEAGETVGQRLQEIRLEQTQRLLSETDLTLAEIGPHVGIRDSAYLANWYRKHTQMSPMAYRKKVRVHTHATNMTGR